MQGFAKHFIDFSPKLNKFNNTGAQILNSIFSYGTKTSRVEQVLISGYFSVLLKDTTQ